MSNPELTTRIRLDDSEAEEQEAQWKLRIRRLNQEITRTRGELKRTELYGITVVMGVMSLMSVIAQSLPEPLRMIGTSVVTAVNAVVAAITSTALAYSAAAAANPVFAIQAMIAWTGVAIAVYGVFQAIATQQRMDSEISRIQQGIRQTSSSLNSILRGLGGYG
jgi:predicted ferric reductase